MAKRLEVVLKWARQALQFACRREPVGDIGKKLEVIRAGAKHEYPTADIDGMLAEIEIGYGPGTGS